MRRPLPFVHSVAMSLCAGLTLAACGTSPTVAAPPTAPTADASTPEPSLRGDSLDLLSVDPLATAEIQSVRLAARSPQPFYGGPKGKTRKIIYLTFDDGPGKYTPKVLDVLKMYRVKATFFHIGSRIPTRPATERRLVREGHSLQNHTWVHPDLAKLTYAQVQRQASKTNRAIDVFGPAPTCLRPPYGAQNARVRSAVASQRLRLALWNIDTRDWTGLSSKKITRNIVKGARNGGIVLMHDGGGTRTNTVKALPKAIKALQLKGYTFGILCAP